MLTLLVVAAFGKRLHGARKPLDILAELGKRPAGACRGRAFDLLAQRFEFAPDA